MDLTAKAIVFTVAVAAFTLEAIRSRSLIAAGLAFFALPFCWDAIEAA